MKNGLLPDPAFLEAREHDRLKAGLQT